MKSFKFLSTTNNKIKRNIQFCCIEYLSRKTFEGVYKNLKQALDLEQKKVTSIEQLKNIVNSIMDIMT